VIAHFDDAPPGDDLDRGRDRRLAELAAAGDHAAWEQIFLAVYPRLRAYAARRVGVDAADDVIGETMMRAVANIHRFRWTEHGIDPWLFGIARRVAADHHRQSARQARLRPPAPVAPTQPTDVLETNDEHASLRAEFERLPAGDQELLELRIVAGLSPEAVGDVIGKRPGAVRTAQSRALRRLRQRLERP
jgi:RNA polymerase sigma-70 factor (ECF subfamily)